MRAASTFSAFDGHEYLSLETFKKSGEGVRTPVWFAEDPSSNLALREARLFIYTVGDTGKVKRVRNNGRARVAPCDMRGKLLGEWVDVNVEIVTGEEASRGMKLLSDKYILKRILDLFAAIRRRKRVVLSIRPA
jgi:uncharacterized protein